MKAQDICILTVVGVAGSAFALADPVQLEPSSGDIRHAGHIYFNVATGEKITTLIEGGDAQGAVGGQQGTEIWIADTRAQCAAFGYSTSYFFGLDDPMASTLLSLNAMLFDWGDIAFDTVVDCVQIHWISDHADTDTDSDSVADGVAGFAGNWVYWEAMNGRSPQLECISMPIIGMRFYSLPGEYPVDPAFLAMWTADIDLGATFGTSMTFEIGDTDSDLQGAAVHNPRMDLQDEDSDSIPDIDPDADGLADWGWSIQFNQPGTIDVDNADGDSNSQTGIDGDWQAMATAGVVFGSPTPGHAEMNTAGGWDWVSDATPAYITEDLFGLATTSNPDGSGVLTWAGTYWFGGFDCSAGQTTGYSPAAHFQTALYANGEPGDCPPDITLDGVLDFFDISAFLSGFGVGEDCDYNGDGVCDFFDISAFLADFMDGCGPFPW